MHAYASGHAVCELVSIDIDTNLDIDKDDAVKSYGEVDMDTYMITDVDWKADTHAG